MLTVFGFPMTRASDPPLNDFAEVLVVRQRSQSSDLEIFHVAFAGGCLWPSEAELAVSPELRWPALGLSMD